MENLKLKVRFAKCESELPQIIRIEERSFPDPWTDADFRRCLQAPKSIPLVCEFDEVIVGFLVYQFDKESYYIENLAVDPCMRRSGVATALLQYVIKKLNSSTKSSVEATISDRNLDAHLFFKSLDFQAVKVQRDFYGEGHDAYDFLCLKKDTGKNKKQEEDQLCRGK